MINKIKLSQFRNYESQEIKAGPGINVIFGDNAQGKTNILEAIYLCACARSHRTAKDSDLILKAKDQYSVKLDFECQNGSNESIEIRYLEALNGDPQRTRSIRQIYHNDLKLERIGDLMGLFHAVIFAPEDLMLIKEGPSTRRRYLDLIISQINPGYFIHLQQYARILTQRNKLLKELREKGYGRNKKLTEALILQLSVWDDALEKEAAAVIQKRQQYVQRINQIANDAQKNISSGKEKLNVKYKTVSGINANDSRDQITSRFRKKLKLMIYEDIEKGLTQIGPHRDDLELTLNGSSLKTYASQGQQRSVALSLKLAELNLISEETGEMPVLLLDDVMSELDESRRTSLLNYICKAQVFVTCTDANQVVKSITELKRSDDGNNVNQDQKWSFYHVNQGQVKAMDKLSEYE